MKSTQVCGASVGQCRWKSSRKAIQSGASWWTSKYRSGNDSAWSMPTMVGVSPASSPASQWARSRRHQYLRGLGGGRTSCGGVSGVAL
jgi:hypothetical protein